MHHLAFKWLYGGKFTVSDDPEHSENYPLHLGESYDVIKTDYNVAFPGPFKIMNIKLVASQSDRPPYLSLTNRTQFEFTVNEVEPGRDVTFRNDRGPEGQILPVGEFNRYPVEKGDLGTLSHIPGSAPITYRLIMDKPPGQNRAKSRYTATVHLLKTVNPVGVVRVTNLGSNVTLLTGEVVAGTTANEDYLTWSQVTDLVVPTTPEMTKMTEAEYNALVQEALAQRSSENLAQEDKVVDEPVQKRSSKRKRNAPTPYKPWYGNKQFVKK